MLTSIYITGCTPTEASPIESSPGESCGDYCLTIQGQAPAGLDTITISVSESSGDYHTSRTDVMAGYCFPESYASDEYFPLRCTIKDVVNNRDIGYFFMNSRYSGTSEDPISTHSISFIGSIPMVITDTTAINDPKEFRVQEGNDFIDANLYTGEFSFKETQEHSNATIEGTIKIDYGSPKEWL